MRVHLEVNPPGCRCSIGCEFPCHQRVGWAEACQQCECQPFAVEPEEEVEHDE